MQVNVTVTHTLAPEITDLLKQWLSGKPVKTAIPVVAPPVAPQEPAADEQVPTAPAKVSLAEVRALAVEKINEGKEAAVQSALEAFGAKKLTELDKKHYADFKTKLQEV